MKAKGKRGFEIEVMGWWIIGITILVITFVGYMILKEKNISALDFIKNIFRFGS